MTDQQLQSLYQACEAEADRDQALVYQTCIRMPQLGRPVAVAIAAQ
jgi:hypothetical protein